MHEARELNASMLPDAMLFDVCAEMCKNTRPHAHVSSHTPHVVNHSSCEYDLIRVLMHMLIDSRSRNVM